MKGLWILAGLGAAAAVLAFALGRDSTADIERAWTDAVRERPTIAASLGECGDLVRWFSDIKPTERKKGELEQLRRRFEALEKSADEARTTDAQPREQRKQALERIEGDFWTLKRDAEDLRARLREMKNYTVELQPRIARLGDRMQRLLAVQEGADPEFQQRSNRLIEEGRKFRGTAESALQRLSVKIAEGRTLGLTALNELDEVLKNMDELLAMREPPVPAPAAADER